MSGEIGFLRMIGQFLIEDLLPALVLQRAPATVGVPGPQALVTVCVLGTVLDLDLAQPLVSHHVHVVPLEVKQKI